MTTIRTKGKGHNWRRSVEAAERRVKDDAVYLISRNGGWFRPHAQGYTGEVADAGLFLGSDARGYLGVEGVSLTPIEDVKKRMMAELDALNGKIAGIWAKRQALEESALRARTQEGKIS